MQVIYGVFLKVRCIIIPESLQRQVLEQLHINHMRIEKAKLLVCKLIYWIGINIDIKNHIKIALHVLIFKLMQTKET